MTAGTAIYAFTGKHEIEEVWDLYQDLRTMPWQPGTTPTSSPIIAPTSDGLVLGINGAF